MEPKISSRFIVPSQGILELLYKKGYRHYMLIDRTGEWFGDVSMMYFEVRFYKTRLEADIGYALIDGSNILIGHILDSKAREIASGVAFCKFLMREKEY